MLPEHLSSQPVELVVGPEHAGWRLDVFLAHHFPNYSRVHLRRVITAGGVRIGPRGGKPAYRLLAGQRVVVVLPEIPREAPQPENIPLEILYEDDWLAVVNKPAGMVVHPARGHWSGTLASALVHHFGAKLSALGGLTRPGIVHRLDRDTSGAIIVAKHDLAHSRLGEMFQARSVEKEYFALVAGNPELDRDWIDEPIGMHPRDREKMAILRDGPSTRSAETFYEVVERFDGFAAVRILPKTGRTHQIRVHLGHIGCPVLCDRQYGGRARITRGEIRRGGKGDRSNLCEAPEGRAPAAGWSRQIGPVPFSSPGDGDVLLERQALHARRLKLAHPESGEPLEVEAPLAGDIAAALSELRQFRRRS